jgi:hypothetical protein
MNVITDTAAGPCILTPHEAQQRIAQLERMRDTTTRRGLKRRLQKSIDDLQRVANPELTYEGWT